MEKYVKENMSFWQMKKIGIGVGCWKLWEVNKNWILEPKISFK